MSPSRLPQPPVYALKAEFFRALGHPVRVRILQLLRDGELSVGALQAELELDSSGTSQHLAALRKQGLVSSRKDGTSVYYSVRDGRTLMLLQLAKEIIAANLEENRQLLDELAAADFAPAPASAPAPVPASAPAPTPAPASAPTSAT
ncbi:MAG: metalloregulator ArsR/SmtB family transcription factor [Actinomycetota bacterium]|nr:metalloregulator ArsR/SmtB family transcription factor [Actinomycetota bacterium]